MGKSDRKRMYELGEWLEQYLNPKIVNREYTELARKAIDLYNIDFILHEDELSISVIEYINNDKNLCNKLTHSHRLGERKTLSDIYFLKDSIGLSRFLIDRGLSILPDDNLIMKEALNKKKLPDFLWTLITDVVGLLGYNRKTIIDNFFKISEGKTLLDDILKNISNISLINEYDLLSSKIILMNNQVIKKRCFVYDKLLKHQVAFMKLYPSNKRKVKKLESTELVIPKVGQNEINIFYWGAILARIFFDFLLLEGQKYFIFCKHCGRFSLIKRLKPGGSPEKLFCSDTCRTADKRV